MSMPTQQSPYLRTQRRFPQDSIQELTKEVDKAYIDTAQKVNSRVIGTYSVNAFVVTGEEWFLTGQPNRQQTLRRVYKITGAGSIAHGINVSQISGFTRIYGTFTDGTNWYTLPYVNTAAANNQISVQVTPTNIVITAGTGAPPTISSGYIILEYLSNV